MQILRYNLKHRHATWLELFFDLVFVGLVGFITHDLSHYYVDYEHFKSFFMFPVNFIPFWWVWVCHTRYCNIYDTDSRYHRFATLTIMLLLILSMALLKSESDYHYKGFVVAYVFIKIILSTMYFLSVNKHPSIHKTTKNLGTGFLIGAIVTSSSLFFSSLNMYVMIYLGILIDIFYPFIKHKKNSKKIPIHLEHLVERTGLLIIILQGESFISLIGALQNIPWDFLNIITAVSAFVMTCAIWWIYFDSFNNLERAKRVITGKSILYTNLLVCIAFIILASIIRHAVLHDIDKNIFSFLAILGMSLFYIGKQIPYYILFPIYRGSIIFTSVSCILITCLSTLLPKVEYTLIGMTAGILLYTTYNLLFVLKKDVTPYLKHHAE